MTDHKKNELIPYSVFKLECLKLKHHINYFAIPMKLFVKVNQIAYQELLMLRAV